MGDPETTKTTHAGQEPTKRDPPNTVVISEATPNSSPRSTRLARLCPPNPLTPEAMRRIDFLTVHEEPHRMDPSKLSPISPSPSITSSVTSDLGSSPRSSISITTSSSFTWSAYRESKMSSSDFTDADSEMCKDLFSPSITLSPAPYSPFSDQPMAIGASASEPTSTPTSQRLHFTFEPKSPGFMPPSKSHFLLPPQMTYGSNKRERSRSDSDTMIIETSDDGSGSSVSNVGSAEKVVEQADEHKHLFKKRLLRKYEEEKSGSSLDLEAMYMDDDQASFEKTTTTYHRTPSAISLPIIQKSPSYSSVLPSPIRCASSLSDYGQSSHQWPESTPESPNPQRHCNITTPLESVRLPLLRLDERNLPTDQMRFDFWLKNQVMAVNPLWFPGAGAAGPAECSGSIPHLGPTIGGLPSQSGTAMATAFTVPPHPMIPHQLHRPSPIYPIPTHRAPLRYRPLHPPPQAFVGPLWGRRSRSESDVSYECHQCGQSFNLRDRLAKHVASRHKEPKAAGDGSDATKTHKCTVCQKQFGRSDMLTRHMRLHTGIRPYVCNVCGQVFSRSDHLTTHQRTHTGEKPYQCPICPYAASRRDMITRHMRTHTRASAGSYDDPNAHLSAIEKALDRAALVDVQTPDDPSTSGIGQWQVPKSKSERDLSPSDNGSSSTGSASTVLCLEDEA